MNRKSKQNGYASKIGLAVIGGQTFRAKPSKRQSEDFAKDWNKRKTNCQATTR